MQLLHNISNIIHIIKSLIRSLNYLFLVRCAFYMNIVDAAIDDLSILSDKIRKKKKELADPSYLLVSFCLSLLQLFDSSVKKLISYLTPLT